MERRGGIELQEGAGGLPHAWPANTHYKATPLPTTSGFLRYFRACSLSPVRQGTPRVPQGTWGVLWERNVCPYWMLMEFPISLYVVVGLLAHIPNSTAPCTVLKKSKKRIPSLAVIRLRIWVALLGRLFLAQI